ncbi:class I SAM-dependent methyltransferase [Mesorhizobium loti]|nr:class I SAM-dependent methyltransferase [Mesorhizobium loti]
MSEADAASDTEMPYALGHSEGELRRLSTQARLIDSITRRFFVEAGIAQGMRVLDVGSGAGDVAILLADIVGPAGAVIGTDTSSKALEVARYRVAELGLSYVSFEEVDPTDKAFDEPFDAIAGRYVLQFMPDPAAALAKLAAKLRPGGLIIFHELDWKGARSMPPALLYDRCCALCMETIRRLGAETSMGLKLHAAYLAAGLAPPSMRLEAVIGSGPAGIDRVHLVTDLVATLLPDMERLGVTAKGEIDIETLPSRVLDEVVASGSVVIGRAEIGAWSRV